MMEKLDKRFDMISDFADNGSTYLISRKENKFFNIIHFFRKLNWKKEFEKNKE